MAASTSKPENVKWERYATKYDPIKVASIDGLGDIPHDRAVIRAIKSKYKPNHKVVGHPLCTIFIGRLHFKTTEETLLDVFSQFGKILRCRVVKDIFTGVSKCYAFIEFKERRSAIDAVRTKQRLFIDNCQVVVEHEAERTLPGWKPRRLGGGFGGYKESGQLRFGCKTRPFRRPEEVKRFDPKSRKHKRKSMNLPEALSRQISKNSIC